MLRGILLVLFGACSFGILSTFVKLAYKEGYTLGDVTGTQALFGVILLWSIYFIQRKTKSKDQPKPFIKTHWLKLMLAGTVTGLVSLTYYQCVKLVPASIAIILLMQFVWMSSLLEFIFFKKKPSKLQILAIIFILIGTVAASGYYENTGGSLSLLGIGYGLAAALCYATFLLLNGNLGNEYPPIQKSALMITGACLLIFLVFQNTFNRPFSYRLWVFVAKSLKNKKALDFSKALSGMDSLSRVSGGLEFATVFLSFWFFRIL